MNKDEENILRLKSNEIKTMFDIYVNILMKYSNSLQESENFEKIFSPFILCRYLSMNNSLFPISEYLSTVYSTAKLTNIQFYKLAFNIVPKQKSYYIHYIKKNKRLDENEINNNNENNINESSLYNL